MARCEAPRAATLLACSNINMHAILIMRRVEPARGSPVLCGDAAAGGSNVRAGWLHVPESLRLYRRALLGNVIAGHMHEWTSRRDSIVPTTAATGR